MTGQALIIQADALRLPLPDRSVDAIVTDPPYGLEFMGKDWDQPGAVARRPSLGLEDALALYACGFHTHIIEAQL